MTPLYRLAQSVSRLDGLVLQGGPDISADLYDESASVSDGEAIEKVAIE